MARARLRESHRPAHVFAITSQSVILGLVYANITGGVHNGPRLELAKHTVNDVRVGYIHLLPVEGETRQPTHLRYACECAAKCASRAGYDEWTWRGSE